MSTRAQNGINIAVVAPGFSPSLEVQKKFKVFSTQHPGFNFNFPSRLIQKNPLFANEEAARAEFLVNALKNDANDVVWCLRGGYGSLPLLKYLKNVSKPKKPKLLVGLSDITSLHLFLNEVWDWSSIHGSNLDRWISDQIPKPVLAELSGILTGTRGVTTYKNIKPVNELAKEVKSGKSRLTGGNLVTLTSHLGTPFQTSFKNRFVFLEEIGERGYRIDRCLTQLSLSGVLKGCQGVLLGQFTSCNEPNGKKLWPWVVREWAKGLEVPVYSGVPSGHEKAQWPLSFGTAAEVKKVNDRWNLIIENKK